MPNKTLYFTIAILALIFSFFLGFFFSKQKFYSSKSQIVTIPNDSHIVATTSMNYLSAMETSVDEEVQNCGAQSNAGEYMCVKEILARLSNERTWKQKKLEEIKHPQINKFEFGLIEEAKANMKKWRLSFDKARDEWCLATSHSFINGSGVPEEELKCKIQIEEKAIEDLNSIYYDQILDAIHDSQGINDFEFIK